MKIVCVCFFVLLLGACSSPPPSPKTLRISFNSHPATLDSRKSGDFLSSTLICLLFEGLTRCLPDGSVEPALAEMVEISKDQRIYTFHLRPSIWNDGKPVTAYDFERTWKEILDPSFPSFCPYLLYPIKNGEKYARGEAAVSDVGVRALSPHLLQVELERPTPYFLSLTAFPLLLPVPLGMDEKNEIVGNGPFRIKKMVPNGEIELEKNPQFWNPKGIHLDKIHISIVPDETTAFQMFERGELDWLGSPFSPIPLDALDRLHASPYLRFIPMAATTFCSFNTQSFPFQNLHLRKAFSAAIDRANIVDKITQAGQIAATRSLPPSLFQGENKALFPLHDPMVAREELEKGLKELGIERADLESLVLYYKPGQVEKRLAQGLQTQWENVLGVRLQLEQIDAKSLTERLQKRKYQIALASWIAQFHDPINILERYKSPQNLKNYAAWENPRFALLLNEAVDALDPDKRIDILEKAEELFAEEVPVAPIYHWSNPSLSGPKIAEIPTTPSGGILFEKGVILKKV